MHTTSKLDVPDNITPIFLPSRAPELNPVENVWQYLRQNWLSNTVFENYDAIIDAACAAWRKLIAQPETITSIGMREWLTSVSRYDSGITARAAAATDYDASQPLSGASNSAVMRCDFILRFGALPSGTRTVPGYSVKVLRPFEMVGRSATWPRSAKRSSSGKTSYLAASASNSACSSASLPGCWSETSFAWLKSEARSYSSHLSFSKSPVLPIAPRHAVTRRRDPAVVVDARLPMISKY